MNVPFKRPDRPLVAAPKREWRMTLVIVLTAIAVLFLAFGTPAAIAASNTTAHIDRGTQITGCRAQASAKVTNANTNLNVSVAENAILENQFLSAITAKDYATLTAIGFKLTSVRQTLQSRHDELIQVNAMYQTAIKQSNTDPIAFLLACAKDKG